MARSREAIRTLEGRRLLERIPHMPEFAWCSSRSPTSSSSLAMREALEGMACRQAAEHMTGPEIRQLRETASRIEQLIQRRF